MGLEAICPVRQGKRCVQAKVHLDTDSIIVRGELRLSIPFNKIRSATAHDGVLEIDHEGTVVELELGRESVKWASRILNPKRLIDKLGVKADSKVSVVGVDDEVFRSELRETGATVVDGKAGKDSDFIFVFAGSAKDLDRLAGLKKSLKPAGAIWAVWAKGKGKPVSENDIRAAGTAAGLVDVKVAKFSETLSALKMVIPLAARR